MAMRDVLPDDWTPRLADAVAAAVREFAPSLGGTPVALFAVDCQPWHGLIELSALSAAEVAADPLLADPSEIAAWRHYDFAVNLPSWQPAEALGREMQAAYDGATDPCCVAAALARAVRRRDRQARGLCTICGYDLRASPGRCPECGASR